MVQYGTPKELIPQMNEVLSRNEGFWLTVTGYSMTPTLKHLKDKVYIKAMKEQVKTGDILLVDDHGTCILHRVVKCINDEFYLRGDIQSYCEGPFTAKNIVGKVAEVQKGNIKFPINCMFRYINSIYRKLWKIKRYIFL